MSSPRSSVDSPVLADASTSRLVLLPNTDDDTPQDYTDDDENEDNDTQPDINPTPIAPLAPSVVFLYLLSPYLRLGAVYAFDISDTSLAYGFVGLIVAATLSAFCRQIWFLLGRYTHKSSTEDILIHTFSRRHRRVGRKHILARSFLSVLTGLFKLLLAAMYLRDAVDSAFLLHVPESIPLPSRLTTSIVLSILVFVLSLPRSLASKSVKYTTGLSVASYLAWLIAVSRSYGAREFFLPNLSSFRRGVLWTEISSITFACTTTMTVPLSASLLAGTSSVPLPSKNAGSRSFQLLNMLSTALAVLLLTPLVIISVSPRTPTSMTTSNDLILSLRIITLVSSIPSVFVSITSLPSHGILQRLIRTDTGLCIVTLTILALSLIPSTVASTLGDAMLFFAVLGGFVLPALAHITIHYFRRPLAIVVPQAPSSVPGTPRPSSADLESPRDPLLQRKERLLQRSRFGKRLYWDLVIWIFLIPACACAFVWATGRLARQW